MKRRMCALLITVIILGISDIRFEVAPVQPEHKAECMKVTAGAADIVKASAEAPIVQQYKYKGNERYMLSKLAMAEAENQDIEGKALVICTVANRIDSELFPSDVEEVIFQKNQFSPIEDGRWNRVEPNEECWEALRMVEHGWDKSQGALYFEVTRNNHTWHARNLDKLFEHEDMTFYK